MKIRQRSCGRVVVARGSLAAPPAAGSAADRRRATEPTPADLAIPTAGSTRCSPISTLAALPTTLRMPQYKMALPRHAPLHAIARTTATSAIWSATSSASTRARGSASSSATGCCRARSSASTGRAIARSRSSASRACCNRRPDGHPLEHRRHRDARRRPTTCATRSRRRARRAARREGRQVAGALRRSRSFVVNSNPDLQRSGDNNTAMIGLGRAGAASVPRCIWSASHAARERLPAGPACDQASFGIEMRAGGHTFQINILERLRHHAGPADSAAA